MKSLLTLTFFRSESSRTIINSNLNNVSTSTAARANL